jgi:hypothetical protein
MEMTGRKTQDRQESSSLHGEAPVPPWAIRDQSTIRKCLSFTWEIYHHQFNRVNASAVRVLKLFISSAEQ